MNGNSDEQGKGPAESEGQPSGPKGEVDSETLLPSPTASPSRAHRHGPTFSEASRQLGAQSPTPVGSPISERSPRGLWILLCDGLHTLQHSPFHKCLVCITILITVKVGVVYKFVKIPTNVLILALILCALFDWIALCAWRASARKSQKFNFRSVAFAWGMFGTILIDAVSVVYSLRTLQQYDGNKLFHPISMGLLVNAVSIVYINSFCYSFFSKTHFAALVLTDVLEILDIAQSFYIYVTQPAVAHPLYTSFLVIGLINYIAFWIGSRLLSIPLTINMGNIKLLTSKQEIRVARYLEALTIVCDMLTDTPVVALNFFLKVYTQSTLKKLALVFSCGMLARAWIRGCLLFYYRGNVTAQKSRCAAFIYSGHVTQHKLVKSKVQRWKFLMLDLSQDSLRGEHLADPVSRGLVHNPPGLIDLNLSYNMLNDRCMKLLAAGLKFNKHLKHLDLSKNNIQDLGVRFLVTALECNESMEILILDTNILSTVGGRLLLSLVRSHVALKTISVRYNGNMDERVSKLVHMSCHPPLYYPEEMDIQIHSTFEDELEEEFVHQEIHDLELPPRTADGPVVALATRLSEQIQSVKHFITSKAPSHHLVTQNANQGALLECPTASDGSEGPRDEARLRQEEEEEEEKSGTDEGEARPIEAGEARRSVLVSSIRRAVNLSGNEDEFED